ncbi:MAG TPA: hypothetical protein VNM66_03700 [Thermodesulfobacteriota bacterium]|nr:hypothetical protein [Thermodesulfobacteriota bacterium]
MARALALLIVLAAVGAPAPAAAYVYAMSTHPVPEAYKAALAATRGEGSWAEAHRRLAEAYQQIEEAEKLAGKPLAKPVEEALASRSRARILRAFHEAIAWVVAYKLDRAEANFDDERTAKALIRQAELIYEPADPVVKARSPETSRAIGQGFLRLREALGSPALFGFGGSPPDKGKFTEIRQTLVRTIREELSRS